jgi:TRAP-type C4-dicarboxylate transport system substrate-binding protein
MKRFFGVKCLFLVFFAATCLAFFPVMASAQKVITLNYSNFFPAPHKNSVVAQQWCKEVEKRSGGKVKITYFPGGTLTPAAQTYDNVVKGIADIGESCFAYTRGKFPMMETLDLPLGYKSGVAATNLTMAFYAKFQPKELADVKVLWLHAHGPGILHTKKPVSKLEDIKGMKIRATGLAAKVVQALGAAPVGTTMPETYDALRTGVADGAMAPVESLQGWKWGEVVKSTTQNFGSAYTTAMFVVMNKAKWAALPPDVQKVFDDVSKEWVAKQGKVWDEIDKEGYAYSKARGNKVIALSKEEDARWAKAVRPLLDEQIKSLKGKGLPGDEAVKFAVDFLKKN